uniref:Allantoate permease n=1 Tax=Escherichia virus LS2 TaxID=2743776 RepID=A0A7D5JS81_9CAUD
MVALSYPMLTPEARIARLTDDLSLVADSFLTFRSLIPLVSLVSPMLTPEARIARLTDDLSLVADSFLTFRSLIPLVSLVSTSDSAPMSTDATSSLRVLVQVLGPKASEC